MAWRLADAKNRFSEVFNRALAEGPQRVLRRHEAVVVLSERDYEKLNLAQMLGWRCLRFTNKQVLRGEAKSFLEKWL